MKIAHFLAVAAFIGLAGPAVAQSSIRTVDIPPSTPEPPQRPELDLSSFGQAREGSGGKAVDVPLDQGDADARAAAEAEAVRLRAANAEQLSAARRQLDRIEAEKQAERERLAKYREQQAAHAAAMADYDAQLAASKAARERWANDVAACRAGDWSRCDAPRDPSGGPSRDDRP